MAAVIKQLQAQAKQACLMVLEACIIVRLPPTVLDPSVHLGLGA